MDPQNPLKNRISQILRSSLASCKSRRHLSDVIERPVSTRQHYQLMELFSPKPNRPVFNICGQKKLQTEEMFPRRKVTKRITGPPVSPVTPLETWPGCEKERMEVTGVERKVAKKKSKKAVLVDKKGKKKEKKRNSTTLWPTNISNNNYYDWSTSDDEIDTEDDDKTTLFSSKSLSSDSSGSISCRSRQTKLDTNDQTAKREGFAVVKQSSDPYNDFRTSMVEMILEKQIFRARELEDLLQTFISLNSSHHHRIIIEVFTEIWEALFSDWS